MGDCCYLSFPGWSGQVARYAGARLVLKELGTGARLSLGTKCLGWSQLSIGSDVGIVVGTVVGSDVGCAVGSDVGSAVGCDVGSAVGCDVGTAVGADVGVGEPASPV